MSRRLLNQRIVCVVLIVLVSAASLVPTMPAFADDIETTSEVELKASALCDSDDPKDQKMCQIYRTGASWYNPFTEQCSVKTGEGGTDVVLVGDTIEEQVWNFLIERGLTSEQAAGVMGNLEAESGFDPNVVEHGNGIGFGLAQWSFGRRINLESAAAAAGKSAGDVAFQLQFLYDELNSRSIDRSEYQGLGASEWEGLTKQTTVDDALVFFHHEFEISYLIDQPNPRQAVIDARGGVTTPNGKRGAQYFFDTYGGSTSDCGLSGDVMMPVDQGYTISRAFAAESSDYSSGYHKGTDFAAAQGSPVYAIATGEVVDKVTDREGNTIVTIRHADGLESLYWHMDWADIVVNKGDTVNAGQKIGAIGMSGQTSGPHLHFELRISGIQGYQNTASALQENASYEGIPNICSKTDYYGCGFIDGNAYLKKYASNYPG